MTSSSTALEEMHHIEPRVQVGRARAAVIMFMLSDILSVFAIFAAGGYLSVLNVLNQYKVPGDHPPAFVPGLVVAIMLVVSGVAYYGWERERTQRWARRSKDLLHSFLPAHDCGNGPAILDQCAPGLCRSTLPCLRERDYAAYLVFSRSPRAGSDHRRAAAWAHYARQVSRTWLHSRSCRLLVVLHSDC